MKKGIIFSHYSEIKKFILDEIVSNRYSRKKPLQVYKYYYIILHGEYKLQIHSVTTSTIKYVNVCNVGVCIICMHLFSRQF